MVDGVRSEVIRVVCSVPQGSLFRISLFLLYSSDQQMVLENTLVDYADYSTLLEKSPSPVTEYQLYYL